MNKSEIWLLSRYSAAELSGALIIGNFARNTKDDFLRKKLTWQCQEEAHHALIWAQVLIDKNLPLLEVHDDNSGKNKEYFYYSKDIENDVDFLAWTHIFELRTDYHLKHHLDVVEDDGFKSAILQIMAEEEAHMDWIPSYLKKMKEQGDYDVLGYLQKWDEIENRTYLQFLNKISHSGDDYLESLASKLSNNLSTYEKSWKSI
jgi:rubrerythrin